MPHIEKLKAFSSLSGFFLSCCSHMGIGIQSEPCGKVAQHTGHRLNVHAILQGDGGEGVAEVMEPNL